MVDHGILGVTDQYHTQISSNHLLFYILFLFSSIKYIYQNFQKIIGAFNKALNFLRIIIFFNIYALTIEKTAFILIKNT